LLGTLLCPIPTTFQATSELPFPAGIETASIRGGNLCDRSGNHSAPVGLAVVLSHVSHLAEVKKQALVIAVDHAARHLRDSDAPLSRLARGHCRALARLQQFDGPAVHGRMINRNPSLSHHQGDTVSS
jgi:hypothetical protein